MSVSGNEDASITINGTRVAGDEYSGSTIHEGPVTVSAGVPFSVETVTFGGGCWDSVAPSTVTVQGPTATVDVFDEWVWDADVWCTTVLTYQPRTDRVTLSSPGAAEVVIRGEYVDITAPFDDRFVPYELRFPVIVR